MDLAILTRQNSSDHGTRGYFVYPAVNFSCHVMELPWRGNARRKSCIPAGEYVCVTRQSPRFGITFHLRDVAGRDWILIHSGNFAGDTTKGLRTNSHGCLLFGTKPGFIDGQQAVLNSRLAVSAFMRAATKTFKIIIR